MKRALRRVAGLLLLLAGNMAVVAHVHLQIAWRQDTLALEIYDFEAGIFPSDAFPFVIGNAGMNLIPFSPGFSFLGEAGATFFALPQSENPNLPYLGIGVDNIPAGTFVGNEVNLRLLALEGPGHFAMYQADTFGQPRVLMNTRDGIAPAMDRLVLATGAHDHQNWAFSAPGEYRLTFVADAVRHATKQTISSAPGTYRFRILPPPAARLELTAGSDAALNLVVHSRVGARLQLLETADFVFWTTNATSLLMGSSWQTNAPGTGSGRFWRVEEVFP